MVATNKEFQLFHTYKNVSKLEDEGTLLSPSEEHFNVQWYMAVSHKKEDMAVYLHCNILGQTEETWCINAEFEFTLKNSCGKRSTEKTTVKFTNLENIVYGWKKFISWEMLAKDYIIDDIIIAEATVKVTNMTGILKKKLRSFEKSEEEFSDVVLAVEDEKFHVLKKFLASHSTYFNALLLGNFKEAEISEVALKDIDSTDFQNLLEVLYGESAIDEDTIEGILHLAHMYDMPFPTRKCEEFLIDFSEKPIKEKLKVAKKYQLEDLKMSCLMKTNTIDEIKAALAGDSTEMDVTVLAALLEKTLTFH